MIAICQSAPREVLPTLASRTRSLPAASFWKYASDSS
jgi:hypothetical protein